MKIAVVGSGVSGLVAARELDARHEVTLFEANDYPGGHTHTIEVEEDGRRIAIDTGFIVFNDRTYPSFTKLLDQLEVASAPTEMSFSVSCERTGLEYGVKALSAVLAQPTNLLRPRFHRMWLDVRRFHRETRALLASGDEKMTLRDFLTAGRYSDEFVERYLVPLGASIWSASPERFSAFPARRFVAFFANHGLLGVTGGPRWRIVRGGSQRYVDALLAGFTGRLRLDCPVRQVRRLPDRVELTTLEGESHGYDRIIIATHSDEALALLSDASPAERAILSAIPYQRNDVVVHTDPNVMPRRRRAWGCWNYRIPRSGQERVAVTYFMNRLQHLDAKRHYFVTLNQSERIDPARVIARFRYAHPVYTPEAVRAQQLHAEIEGVRRTHYCGAYWGYGFHEDGVWSAFRASRAVAWSL